MTMQLWKPIALVLIVFAQVASAADYRAEALKEAAPADALSAEISGLLAPQGVRIIRGTKTTYCEVWLCKELAGTAGFKPNTEVLYPFKPGQLIGAVRFSRKGSDFRDQDIGKGVYTLRYAQQPVDGAHVGTSPTRDFLLLLRADQDKSAQPLGYDDLAEQSSEAAESTHPCLLSMQRVQAQAKAFPAMRHQEDLDWWIVGLSAQVKDGAKAKAVQLDVVISGAAVE